MLRLVRRFCILTCLVVSTVAFGADALSEAQIRALIVQDSILAYPGNCPCPFNTDRAGRRRGARSAHSRAGGYSPVCYASEISDAQVREYRARHKVADPWRPGDSRGLMTWRTIT